MCPRILHIYGPLWINGYGLMIALGFLTFLLLTYRHSWRKRLVTGEIYLNVIFLGFLVAVIGGRLLFLATNYSAFSDNLFEIFYPWVGGFSLFGSILAVLLIVPFYLKKHNIAILQFFDLVALYAPLLQAIARMGCFFAGCCYGFPSPHLAWAVTFTSPDSLAPTFVPLHPTQLYSVIASLFIFVVLSFISTKKNLKSGTCIFSYLIFESFARFVVDFFRGDRELMMQPIVFCVFLCSLFALFFVNVYRGKKDST